MNIPKIQSAQAINDHALVVTFTNGKRKKYDVMHLLDKEIFMPLKNPAFFKNVHIEPGGYAVAWNADIDISEYELWKNGVEIN